MLLLKRSSSHLSLPSPPPLSRSSLLLHLLILLLLTLSLLSSKHGSTVEAASRTRHQGDSYRRDEGHHRIHTNHNHDPYTHDHSSSYPHDHGAYPHDHGAYSHDHGAYSHDPYGQRDPYTRDYAYTHDDSYSQEDSYTQSESYDHDDLYKKDVVAYRQREEEEDEDDPYPKNDYYTQEDDLSPRRSLPIPPVNLQQQQQQRQQQNPSQQLSNKHHYSPYNLVQQQQQQQKLQTQYDAHKQQRQQQHKQQQRQYDSHSLETQPQQHNPQRPYDTDTSIHLDPPQPLPHPIKIDFTNATSLSAYEELKAKGTFLLGGGGGAGAAAEGRVPGGPIIPPHGYLLQPPRTWTAGPPPPDYEDDTTTRDPAIPENPEGLKNPSLLVGPWEEEPTVRITNAAFEGVNGSIVEAQSGTTAKIPCVIMNRADHETVSWIRLRDHHLITVGRQTYTNDDRFSVTYNRHLNEWVLHLRYAQHRDAGEYVCQLSTHPPMVFIFTLTITQASSEIAGGPERYVQEGSLVVLNCTLRQHTQPPEYVFWYHNRTMINYVTDREVSVRNTADGSILTLASVGRTDSGNYTCLPPNSRPASITLHIIAGDAPAAMQVSGAWRSQQQQTPHQALLLLLPLLLLLLLLQPRLSLSLTQFS